MGDWFRPRVKFLSRRFILEQLEERIVLDAAVAAGADDNTDQNAQTAQGAEQTAATTPGAAAEAAAAPTQAAADAASSAAESDPLGTIYNQDLNVVLISNAIADIEAVSKAATSDAKVVVYDAQHDTLDSVVTKLQEVAADAGEKIGHLALFAPGGQAGALTLTATEGFTAEDIELHPGSWHTLSTLLAQDARIDLYGCNIGQGAAGQTLVTALATAANATVWASDNPTGNVAGADWALEAHSGESNKPMLIDPARLDGTRIFLADLVGTPGDDTLTNSGTVDNIYGYAGWDTITNTSSGTVLGVIDGGTGNDTINLYSWNNPVIHGGGDGYDTLNLYLSTLTVYGTPTSGSATDGSGHTITWDGFNSVNVMGTGGDDHVTIEAAAQVTFIRTGDGNDIITNHGFVSRIDSGDGADTITNSGTVDLSIGGGLGADTITNSGTVSGDIYGDDGDDTITNTSTGTVTYIYTGDGNDTIINYGTVTTIWLIPGNNTITNYGWITDIWGGTGNDTLNLHLANLTVSGTPGSGSATDGSGHTMTWDGLDIVNVMGTDGDDSVTIAAAAQVTSIQTGDGNDIIAIHGIVSQDIDGGAGYDTINLYTWDNPVIHGGGDALNLHLSTLTVFGTPTSGSARDVSGHTITWDGFNAVNVMGTAGDDNITIWYVARVTSIQTGDGDDIITNRGEVYQNFSGDAGDDTITNSGTVFSSIYGGDGNDSITNPGAVAWYLDGGTGNDTINLYTWSNHVIHGGGNGYDTLNLYLSTLTVYGTPTSGSATDGSGHTITWDGFNSVNVMGTGGVDHVTIAAGGTVTSIQTGAGHDIITNHGFVSQDINSDAGDDTITNSGTVGLRLYGGDGADTIANSGTVELIIHGDAGDDTITNSGTVGLGIDGDDGANTITNSGTVSVGLSCGDGDDTITNSGTVGFILGHGGANNITNSGTVSGNIRVEDGDDTITNTSSGTVLGEIATWEGNNTITNYGWITNIWCYNGNDTLNLHLANLTVSGTPGSGSATDGSGHTMTWDGLDTVNVMGTDGDDSVTIATGATVDEIATRWGNDTITNYGTVTGIIDGGDGNDIILNCGTVGLGIDGGADWDTLYLANATNISSPTLPDGSADYYSDATHFTTVTWQNFEAIDINHAPTMTGGAPSLSAIIEDVLDANNTGTTVSALVAVSGPGDADGDALGMAVIGVSSPTGGHWEYQLNATSAWQSFTGSESVSSAVLLAPTAEVRFVPAADWNGTVDPGITFMAWDQAWGHSGDVNVDLSVPGRVDGTGSVSAATETAAITVSAINDAPVLDISGSPTLTTIAEDDTANTGNTIAEILATGAGGNPVTDVDAGAVEGMAVVGVDNTHGAWQFSTNGGGTWTPFGAVSVSNATVLADNANTRIRFAPAADWNGAVDPGITFKAWDQTGGYANGQTGVNASTGGGATPFSIASETAAITVTAVNDAPVLDNSGSPALTTIAEDDSANAGNTVAQILATGAGGDPVTDVDAGAVEGMAVVGVDNSHGTWQFSTNGGVTWTPFGAVSATNATLLADTANTRIRFVPAANWNGAVDPGITFKAWDQTGGYGNGQTGVNASTGGGATPFSIASETAAIDVAAVNDAPVLDNSGSPALTTIAEDDTGNAGTTIAAILTTGAGGNPVTDVDAGAVEGMAVVGVDNTHGAWQFSTNGGGTWTPFGAVSATNATLLADTANTRIRFVPAPDWNGAVDPGITFEAWDQTGGYVNGQTGVNASTGGGTTPFSIASETAAIDVTAVNDAPVLDNSGAATLTAIAEDDTGNAGNTIAAILATGAGGNPVTDVDAGAVEGMAVVGVDNSHGTWQFSTNGGVTWTAFGTVSGANAAVLADTANTRIRFVPAADWNGAVDPGVTFKAWDQTGGYVNGQTGVNASTGGGTTPFSIASETAAITVTAVNDAPVVTVPGDRTTPEDVPLTIGGVTVTDADAPYDAAYAVRVSLGVMHGAVHLTDTTGLTFNAGGNDQAAMTFTGDLGSVAAALDDLRYTPDSNYNGPDTLTVTANDLGHTGAGPAPNITRTIAIAVTEVNDAPTLVVPGDHILNENTAIGINGIVVSDVDAVQGTGEVQVTLGADHGAIFLGSTAGIVFAPGDANGSAHMTITGLVADVNAALSSLQYTPNLNYFGADSINVSVNDLGNTGAPGALTAAGKFSVTVIEQQPTGRPPIDGLTITGPFGAFPAPGTTGPVDIGALEGGSALTFGTGSGYVGVLRAHQAGAGHATGEGFLGLEAVDYSIVPGTLPAQGLGAGETPTAAPTGLTGLLNYYENVLNGNMLVFNLDDIHFTDLCTDCILPVASRPDIPTGLAGYLEGIKAGKTLVFNLSNINCMDAICAVGG